MQGSIIRKNGIQFTDLLQMLSGGYLSGHLEIKDSNGKTGILALCKGAVVSIDYENLNGIAALAKLLKEAELHFSFRSGETVESTGIYKNTTELLMEASLWADKEIEVPVLLDPSYFTIKNRTVLNTNTNEERQEILAELDFLHHSSQNIGEALGFGPVSKFMLREEEALLAFYVISEGNVLGFQSLKPRSMVEAFDLL